MAWGNDADKLPTKGKAWLEHMGEAKRIGGVFEDGIVGYSRVDIHNL